MDSEFLQIFGAEETNTRHVNNILSSMLCVVVVVEQRSWSNIKLLARNIGFDVPL